MKLEKCRSISSLDSFEFLKDMVSSDLAERDKYSRTSVSSPQQTENPRSSSVQDPSDRIYFIDSIPSRSMCRRFEDVHAMFHTSSACSRVRSRSLRKHSNGLRDIYGREMFGNSRIDLRGQGS